MRRLPPRCVVDSVPGVHTDRWLDVLFGMGDDDFPFWLMSVRVNILLFTICAVVALLWHLRTARARRVEPWGIALALALTALAGALRFFVASANLVDFGGIPYSRLLLGYRGHFATAQFYSLFYELSARDIEHAILFNRVAGTLTIPLVYVLCRLLDPNRTWFAAIAALLFAVSPLHISFSASDGLAIFSVFLAAASYTLLAAAEEDSADRRVRFLHYLGGLSGLVLLTQVRYENVLFLLPAAVFAVYRGRRVDWRALTPAAVVAGVLLAVDLQQGAAAGSSFQNPVRLAAAVEMVTEHVILNPFVGAALLAVGTAGVLLGGGIGRGLGALAVWAAALSLPLLAESGHGAARVFASWLILIIPFAAYGLTSALGAGSLSLRMLGAFVLFCLTVQPLLFGEVFAPVHLEMQEHAFFKDAVLALPDGVDTIVVPDDELLRRDSKSTVELHNKYSMTLAGMGDPATNIRLVRLTDYLEGGASLCRPGACAFFFGLPCTRQRVYPFTRAQCREMRRIHHWTPVLERVVRGAPFVSCSVYVGHLREKLCVPETGLRMFGLYLMTDSTSAGE